MKKFMIWVIAIIVGVYGLYKYNYPTYSWKQKLTVEVETPEGVKSGSSVTFIEWTGNPFSGGWGGASFHAKVQGEAVVVDLGAGKYLFALLSYSGNAEYIASLALRVFNNLTKQYLSPESFRRVLSAKTPTPVPGKVYPLLVTFGDINDPASVRRVDPDDLAASFGAGYKLKAVSLEITDEPVTKGAVEGVLGWVWTHAGYLSGTNRLNRSRPELNLTISDFIKDAK